MRGRTWPPPSRVRRFAGRTLLNLSPSPSPLLGPAPLSCVFGVTFELKSCCRHSFEANGLCGASFLQLSKKLVDFCRNAGTRAGVVRVQGLSLWPALPAEAHGVSIGGHPRLQRIAQSPETPMRPPIPCAKLPLFRGELGRCWSRNACRRW